MEPPEMAVEVLGGDAAEASQEALDLEVAAVDGLDVQGAADPLAGGAVDLSCGMSSAAATGG